MRAVVNGKLVDLPQGATVEDLRSRLPEIGNDDVMEEGFGGTRALKDNEALKEGSKVWTIPKIVKGMTITISNSSTDFYPDTRTISELKLLEKVAKNVVVGSKTLGGVKYTAILIKGMPLSSSKFKVSNSDVLFLLPSDYPRLPPVGCYLNYPWDSVGEGDHHFTRQSYYGAPFLSEEGWYWYCVGLGGGFSSERWLNSWRPSNNPERGHNLATLFVTARHAINSED
jgi:hypothetical protein